MKNLLSALALGLALMMGMGSAASLSYADFEGKPPLGPQDKLRQELLPYDLAKLNCLAINYCENLVDMRVNLTSYTHLDSDINAWDAWNLQFPDDTARFVEGLVFEARYSPVVRLELARKLLKGLMAAHVPGTRAEYFFRHRSAGKTYMIFDDQEKENEGRLTLANWGDSVEGALKVGFRAKIGDEWQAVEAFEYTDTPAAGGHPAVARTGATADDLEAATRTSVNWNQSPYSFKRHYTNDKGAVDFTGRYWFSDANKPIEYTFESKDAEEVDVVVGEPGGFMHLLWDCNPNNIAPGIIHLPDRKTVYHSDKDGSITLEAPDYNYFILRKETVWVSRGHSSALLVMWEGQPSAIEALEDNGYGEIRLRFAKKGDSAGGRVWLYPIPWLDTPELNYVHRNAESFLATGQLMQNGFPSQQMVNAIPAALAAGAWLMTHYNDPMAATVRRQAENAVDAMILPEDEGKWFLRTFFEIKAAAWMVLLGKEMNDQRLIDKYTPRVEKIMERQLSKTLGYDGDALGGGWSHFNAMKAVWLAWEATGREDYKEVHDRALAVYTIDEKGIYIKGELMDAPGGFNTYSGALPLGIWGHAGELDKVEQLINLDVPNGWGDDPTLPVSKVLHDGGAGPWAQDDSQPDFVGYCLRGLNLPRDKQYLLPFGAAPMYDAKGKIRITGERIMENPFFPKPGDTLRTLNKGEKLPDPPARSVTLKPGSEIEKAHMVAESGTVAEGQRVIKAGEAPVTYAFTVGKKATGAALDLTASGEAYQVQVSPDGKRWYQRLDSWSEGAEMRSLDLSFLTGSFDEMVRLETIDPASDGKVIVDEKTTHIERGHCRYVDEGGSFVYRLALPGVIQAQAELIVGNGYHVEISPDGKQWQEGLRADTIDRRDDRYVTDAAWVQMLDLTPAMSEEGEVYLRFSGLEQMGVYDKGAFLRRLAIYGIFKTDKIHVRLNNAGRPEGPALKLDQLTLRSWSR